MVSPGRAFSSSTSGPRRASSTTSTPTKPEADGVGRAHRDREERRPTPGTVDCRRAARPRSGWSATGRPPAHAVGRPPVAEVDADADPAEVEVRPSVGARRRHAEHRQDGHATEDEHPHVRHAADTRAPRAPARRHTRSSTSTASSRVGRREYTPAITSQACASRSGAPQAFARSPLTNRSPSRPTITTMPAAADAVCGLQHEVARSAPAARTSATDAATARRRRRASAAPGRRRGERGLRRELVVDHLDSGRRGFQREEIRVVPTVQAEHLGAAGAASRLDHGRGAFVAASRPGVCARPARPPPPRAGSARTRAAGARATSRARRRPPPSPAGSPETRAPATAGRPGRPRR